MLFCIPQSKILANLSIFSDWHNGNLKRLVIEPRQILLGVMLLTAEPVAMADHRKTYICKYNVFEARVSHPRVCVIYRLFTFIEDSD